METYIYTNQKYEIDIKYLTKVLSENNNLHLVGVHRGSIQIVENLSKSLKCGMSIIKLQTRDGSDEKPVFISNNIKNKDNIFVIEDIYDTGKTIRLIKEMMKEKYPDSLVNYMSLFGVDNEDGVSFLHNTGGKWISFPWEK